MEHEKMIQWLELLRVALLAELYKNAPNELPQERLEIHMVTFSGSLWSRRDVKAALEFLIDAGYVVARYKPLGASRHFRISSQGTLMMERDYPTQIDRPTKPQKGTAAAKPGRKKR